MGQSRIKICLPALVMCVLVLINLTAPSGVVGGTRPCPRKISTVVVETRRGASRETFGRRRNRKGDFPLSCGQDLLLYIPYSTENVTAWVWLMLSALCRQVSRDERRSYSTFHCTPWFPVQTHKLCNRLWKLWAMRCRECCGSYSCWHGHVLKTVQMD